MKIANKKKISTTIRHNFVTNCLEEVLQYLIEDPGALYSCILVNRNWCRITIPILWSDPFNNIKRKNPNNANLSIRTYISCLEDSGKSTLINEFITIPNSWEEPLFDYPKYLKIFKYDHFGKMLENFVRMNYKLLIEMKTDLNKIYMIITSVIMEMIFKKSGKLITLQYIHDHISSQRIIYTLDLLLYSYNTNNIEEGRRKNSHYISLKKLTTLKFFAYCIHEESYTIIWPTFFNNLAKLAKNIQEIFIHFPSDDEIDCDLKKVYPAIVNLIKSQRNLKRLEINESHCSKMDQKIINSLILTQSNTLTNFKLNGEIKFINLIQLLENCKNLRSIHIYKLNKYGDIPKDINGLIKSSTSSLEKFCHWNPHSFFQYQTNNADYEITLTLRMISKNLKKFACNYILDIVLLKPNMLQSLSSSLPNSLKHLSLNLSISLEFLKIFLINCNINLNTLELYNIRDVNYKISVYINDYYNRNNQLKLLKLDNMLYSKFKNLYYHIHKKKIGYKIVENFKPIWFDENK
ncbi:380_t:CDS:2 [Rhizophagus irregularis]|nr:380_t:CDS:2 [Rhizophagus irregularis]